MPVKLSGNSCTGTGGNPSNMDPSIEFSPRKKPLTLSLANRQIKKINNKRTKRNKQRNRNISKSSENPKVFVRCCFQIDSWKTQIHPNLEDPLSNPKIQIHWFFFFPHTKKHWKLQIIPKSTSQYSQSPTKKIPGRSTNSNAKSWKIERLSTRNELAMWPRSSDAELARVVKVVSAAISRRRGGGGGGMSIWYERWMNRW